MEKIEEFIDDFRTREIDNDPMAMEGRDSEEVIRHLFMCGYCYYFAKILKDAFPGGKVCWAYPFGHVVYLYKGTAYDIEGVYQGESDEFIPIKYLGKCADDFRHIPDLEHNTTEEEMEKIHNKWLRRRRIMKLFDKIFNQPVKNFMSKKYRFLSNFYITKPMVIDNLIWNHSEGYYQSQKDPSKVGNFIGLTPMACKKLGRKVTPTEDWETRKIDVMRKVLSVKFSDKDLKKKLLKTGKRELIEGNYWHDNFWGNCTCEKCKNIEGQNWLGELLMELREQFKNEKKSNN